MMTKVLAASVSTVVAAVAIGWTSVAAAQLEAADCSTLSGALAASCQKALTRQAEPQLFLDLGERLLEMRNFPIAVKVYQRGLQLHGNNSELRAQLTIAKSGLKEWQWMMDQNNEAKQKEAAYKAEIFKCTKLAKSAPKTALEACETALAAMPQDPRLLEAKGDSLLKMGNNAEAYLAFAAAAKQASSPALEEKLTELAAYKPKPEPEPKPVVAKKEPEPQPEPEASDQNKEQERAARQAALTATINDPAKGLEERLKARNTLLSMARQEDN